MLGPECRRLALSLRRPADSITGGQFRLGARGFGPFSALAFALGYLVGNRGLGAQLGQRAVTFGQQGGPAGNLPILGGKGVLQFADFAPDRFRRLAFVGGQLLRIGDLFQRGRDSSIRRQSGPAPLGFLGLRDGLADRPGQSSSTR